MSYISYQSLSNVTTSLTITITFKPTQPNGLILFNPFSNSNFADFISLSLVESRVVYRFNLGSGRAELVSQQLDLDQWHTLTANRTGRFGYLQVNQGELINGTSPGTFTGLNVGGDMWLGGHTQHLVVSETVGVSTGLSGCVSEVLINGISLNLISGAESGYNIGQCNISDICSVSSPCLNGATCINTGNSYTCICDTSYTGPVCASTVLYCVSNPCANGGSCLESVAGFTCLCPFGYAGPTCNQSEFYVN